MKCGNCGLTGHNKSNKSCITNIIRKNLDNMYAFTHNGMYYSLGLQYIIEKHSHFCTVQEPITWNQTKTSLTGFDVSYLVNLCSFRFIFVKMNIINNEGGHANSLLVDKNSRTITRYDPHGLSSTQYTGLDDRLSNLIKGYYYIPPHQSLCLGMQVVSLDKRGLCQTFVLYNLMRKLDGKPGYVDSISDVQNFINSTKEIEHTASLLLTYIYYKLPANLRDSFLIYNGTSDIVRKSIELALLPLFI